MKKLLWVSVILFLSLSPMLFSDNMSKDMTMLPEGTVKISEVIPTMGEHWANPENLPLGPIYMVHDGQILGMEYMFTRDMMSEVALPEGTILQMPNLSIQEKADHFDVEWLPQGHEGFEVPHWDVHVYFVTHADHMALLPDEH
jgi:hypothetical protein